MFQEPFSLWDYSPYLYLLVLVFLICWGVFGGVRKNQIKKYGEPVQGFLRFAPRVFKILAGITFLAAFLLIYQKLPPDHYTVFSLTPEGYQ
ncbi:MAG: hypothetical protein O7C66_04950, partial [Alphaproteobacteria bacterium]|nr:hypothetical protein [Alphaproteobacteria bacterium]